MTSPSRNQVVVRTEPAAIAYPLRSEIAGILSKPDARAAIEAMLRPGDSFDRIVVEVFHAANANADIQRCSPVSIIDAVAKAVSTGLIIGDGVHLVPYGQKLQAILDYKGRVELIVRAGAARSIDAHCVYQNEEFSYTQGTSPTIVHKPIMDPKRRGPMVGAYAIAILGYYRFQSVVLSTDEIEQIRQKYSKQWKSGELPYWYAQKTCVHRLAKLLPKNPELAKVIAMFDREEAEESEAPVEAMQRIEAGPFVLPSEASAPAVEPKPAVRSKAWLFEMPFGRTRKGEPIGSFSPEDLAAAREYARKLGSHQDFLDASDDLLEESAQNGDD